jgi:hypothetical protein
MSNVPFNSELSEDNGTVSGPLRGPKNMLAEQEYDGHTSIHDEETAQKMGFRGGAVEGPTHFSQFDPIGHQLWGDAWFETGCISAHFRNVCYEGDMTRAFARQTSPDFAEAWMETEDGTEVFRGSISIGDKAESALTTRMNGLREPGTLVILHDVKVGMKGAEDLEISMDYDQNMGALYPFSLNGKNKKITEPSPWYEEATGEKSPWGKGIIPFEMVSVLSHSGNRSIPARGPAVGLFADLEINMVKGPLLVGEKYIMEKEIVAISDSRRTESNWTRTTIRDQEGEVIATTLLNSATMKESYAKYAEDLAEIEGK